MIAPSRLLASHAAHEISRLGTATYAGVAATLAHLRNRCGAAGDQLTHHSDSAARGMFEGATRDTRHGAPIREFCGSRRQVIVVSNREPCIHEFGPDGDVIARRPVSGLVTALEPVVRTCGGVWIAHGGGSADRVMADGGGHVSVGHDSSAYLLRRVWLTPEEEQRYYQGFANEGLWPLCHMAFSAPMFRKEDWVAYQEINCRFADAIVSEIRTDRPIVLVQDYHFALLPRLLQARRPDAVIVSFWHIPWPHPEQFSLCPYARELVDGLLGSSIVGFQTPTHCDHFFDTVDALMPAITDRKRHEIGQRRHTVRVDAFPISVEWPSRWTAELPDPEECRQSVCAEFDIDPASALVVSVDRLDYTKGFVERLLAIERLLQVDGRTSRRIAFLQVAAPTRTGIHRYCEFAQRIRCHVANINDRLRGERGVPVTYVERCLEPLDVFRCYRAADVCYVGSLDDGMNLVAKEFVVARDDLRGVLVLSRFAGAARELQDALLVNPFDVDEVADTLLRASALGVAEQRCRMQRMRRHVAGHDVHHWASRILETALRAPSTPRMRPVALESRGRIPSASIL